MRVEDVMTKDLIAVGPGSSIHAAAALMIDHGISGLPVVDEGGRLVGILSEGDLIVRQKPRKSPRWWHLFVSDGEELAREYQRATGTTVGEVMTRSVICIRPDAPLAAAAALLDEHTIRRLPVVVDGELVGIVSRADLIKALATAPAAGASPVTDAQLVGEMTRRMAAEPWVSNGNILIKATDGVLSLWGIVDSHAEESALATMARSIPGCRSVESQLIVRPDLISRYGVT